MPNLPALDFSRCEAELIHLPGAIQACGALVATDPASGRVTHVSANLGAFFARLPEPRALVGMPWAQCAELLGLPLGCRTAPLHAHPKCLQLLEPREPGAAAIEVFAHAGPSAHIWEFQYAAPPLPAPTGDYESRFFNPDLHPYSLAQALTEEIYALTGYDRVMVYHFDADWSGEIIAECRRPSQDPYLGLHYPATDIPSQARQLYRENTVRTINAVAEPTVTLMADVAVAPLDLRHSILRAVSPYHIEYLTNMGVGATLTLSILLEGELWGLITCHHNGPKYIPAATRTLCGQLATRTGHWLRDYLAREAVREAEWTLRDEQRMQASNGMATAEELLARLFFGPERIDPLFEADAAVLVMGETWICTGDVPDADWLRACLDWCESRPNPEEAFATDRLPEGFQRPENQAEAIFGFMVTRLVREPAPITLLLLRRESLREVHWGCDPDRAAEMDAFQRISPRKSFERWSEMVSGHSLPWHARLVARFNRIAHLARSTFSGAELAAGVRAMAASLLDAAVTSGIMGNRLIDNLQNSVAILGHAPEWAHPRLELASLHFSDLMGLPPAELKSIAPAVLLQRLNLPPAVLEIGNHRLGVLSPHIGPRTFSIQHRNFMRVQSGSRQRRLTLLQFIDVTSDERLANALRASNRQLTESTQLAHQLAFKAEAANRAKDEFLANMSHELRTPLNGVLGMASILQQTELSGQQQDYLRVLVTSGGNLLKIIGEILDLAKIEAGKVDLESIEMDLRGILTALELVYAPQAAAKGLQLNFQTAQDIPERLRGDPTRTRQVMENLLSNALKFTQAGSITVRTTLAGKEGTGTGPALRFAVRDTGPGIPADKMDRLFTKFSQVDASTTRQFGGTGLGLAITKQLVELMGGTIGVTSQFGSGAEFWFTQKLNLPNQTAPAPAPAKPTPAPATPEQLIEPAQRGARILLVEDNLINQQVAEYLLTRLGMHVSIANNGEEALAALANDTFAMVFMDIQMPVMDGYECTRRLRDPACGLAPLTLPIIAMTANAMAGDQEGCLRAGMSDYLAKPINPTDLATRLARWLPMRETG